MAVVEVVQEQVVRYKSDTKNIKNFSGGVFFIFSLLLYFLSLAYRHRLDMVG